MAESHFRSTLQLGGAGTFISLALLGCCYPAVVLEVSHGQGPVLVHYQCMGNLSRRVISTISL